MIIKKKKVHQSINQLKNNQKIRENLVWLGRFVLQKKGLNIFKKLLVELSFLHTKVKYISESLKKPTLFHV